MKKSSVASPSAEYFYRWMLAIRHSEQKLKELYIDHKIKGALHLSIGQEAVPVGVCAALSDGDKVFSTHRSHGHYIAKTHDIEGIMAELLGRATGCSNGYGGSMHLYNYEKGFLGGNGIVGGGISLALGAAFSAFYQNNGQIGVTFFGDGAANQGILHETLNLASLLKVPFLAVCENNGVAATTPVEKSTSETDRTKLAKAYKISSLSADGSDVEAVYAAASKAVAHLRAGKGPFLLNLRTCRWEPHCGIIKDTRDQKMLDDWRTNHDPLNVIAGRYPELLSSELRAEIGREVDARIEAAVAEAMTAPAPELAEYKRNFGV
ncbi:MAG: thiamine pyrophosphate-dependent dehydrogenase E1 component subunit alpha [Lentisphaeria bacterium]|nr:thiamine pyrophosphate-dependent dehydrogenase E1 component subunit alpha [Lentisphaeria bacterium]